MRKGFSVVELLVVITIIGLMIGMSIPYFNTRKWNMTLAEDNIKGQVRLARQLAISKQGYYGFLPTIQNDSIIIFEDVNKNGKLDLPLGTVDRVVKVMELPKGLYVGGYFTNGPSLNPDHPVLFNGRGMLVSGSSVVLELEDRKSPNGKKVEIYIGISGFIQ